MTARDLPKLDAPVEITALGAQGDGVAETEAGRVFVPFTLPGEQVRVVIAGRRGDGWMARAVEFVTSSAGRIAPPCPHFGTCGGCMLQHADPELYRNWKRNLVVTALRQRGLEMPADAPLIETPPATRRRARFAAQRTTDGLQFGFHAPESTEIVSIAECHVVTPALAARLPLLRKLASAALGTGQGATVTATETETGLDVLFTS